MPSTREQLLAGARESLPKSSKSNTYPRSVALSVTFPALRLPAASTA
jgi:hypothetical protein